MHGHESSTPTHVASIEHMRYQRTNTGGAGPQFAACSAHRACKPVGRQAHALCQPLARRVHMVSAGLHALQLGRGVLILRGASVGPGKAPV